MRLRIVVPTGIEVDEEVVHVAAEGLHGSFAVLPRHLDFSASLVPGLLSFRSGEDAEKVFAVDRGTLVKAGEDVTVAVWRAIAGQLDELQRAVEEQLLDVSEHEERARQALDRMQADFVRRYVDLEHRR